MHAFTSWTHLGPRTGMSEKKSATARSQNFASLHEEVWSRGDLLGSQDLLGGQWELWPVTALSLHWAVNTRDRLNGGWHNIPYFFHKSSWYWELGKEMIYGLIKLQNIKFYFVQQYNFTLFGFQDHWILLCLVSPTTKSHFRSQATSI